MTRAPIAATSRFAAIVFLTLVAACGSSPTPRLYTLSAEAAAAVSAASRDLPTVAVATVTLPEAVDRRQLVVRTDANEVALAEQHRWAADLKDELTRTIAQNLSRATGNPHVASQRQNAAIDADYRVLVDIQRFEAGPGLEVVVDALWTLRDAGGAIVRAGRERVREAAVADDPRGFVAAYSRALARLSGAIARELASLPAGGR